MRDTARELRDGLVDEVIGWYRLLGLSMPGRVEAVMRTVPRHLFTPGVPVGQAYADDAVLQKTDGHGVTVSSVSAPGIIAMMLGQLGVEPGQRVLEIGSGVL